MFTTVHPRGTTFSQTDTIRLLYCCSKFDLEIKMNRFQSGVSKGHTAVPPAVSNEESACLSRMSNAQKRKQSGRRKT